MDTNMSGRSGFDVLQELKADPSLRCIPVCIFTSSSAEADVARAYKLHANCYVTKPADFQGLQKVIDDLGHFWFDTARVPGGDPAPVKRTP
jgi:CheY-like chemotaxis protein